jgi:hypothetical protein
VGNAISGTLGPEMLPLEVLCRLFGSPQLVLQQNGHNFGHTGNKIQNRSGELNISIVL